MLRSIAVLLFSLCMATQANAAPYTLTSQVSGTGGFFSLTFGAWGFDTMSPPGHPYPDQIPFDIRFSTVVDYAGSGNLAGQPAEVTIEMIVDGVVDITTVTGTVYASHYTSTQGGVRRSVITYDLYAGQIVNNYGDTLHVTHTFTLDHELAAGLATPVPLSPADGRIDYLMMHYNEIGAFGVGHAYADVQHASFSLSPVPEPAQYALLLAGLALTGCAARRRA